MLKYRKIVVFSTMIIAFLLSLPSFAQGSQTKKSEKEDVTKIVRSKYPEESRKLTDYYLRAIYELKLTGDTLAARRYLDKCYALDSLHAPTLFQLGNITRNLGDAVRVVEKAVELDKDNIDYKYQLSSLYSSNEQYIKSIDLIKDLHSRVEYTADTYRYLTALYDYIGDKNMAIRTIDSAMVKYSSDPDIVSYKGDLLLRDNKTVAYVSNCEALDRLVPESVVVKHKLGMAYGMINKDSLAYETLQQAYQIDSTYVPLLSDLANYYRNNKSIKIFNCLDAIFRSNEVPFDLKRRYYNEVLRTEYYYTSFPIQVSKLVDVLREVYDYNFEVEMIYVSHLASMGHEDEYLETLRKLIFNDKISNEDQIIASNNLISSYNYRKNRDSVLYYVNVASERFKEDSEQPLYLAYVLGQNEMHVEALEMLKGRLKQQSDSMKSVYYGTIGDTYYTIGNKKTAYKNYNKSLKYNPENIMILNNYAYYLSLDMRDLDYALEMIKKVIKKEPHNGTYLDTYAWILHLLDRNEEAKTHQLRAIALVNEDNPEIFLHYAEILAALGENLNARRYYRKALESGADAKLIEEKLEILK
ncbi:MAG: tetratricopeptide repeat protein [Rikenellaceae bacterium]